MVTRFEHDTQFVVDTQTAQHGVLHLLQFLLHGGRSFITLFCHFIVLSIRLLALRAQAHPFAGSSSSGGSHVGAGLVESPSVKVVRLVGRAADVKRVLLTHRAVLVEERRQRALEIAGELRGDIVPHSFTQIEAVHLRHAPVQSTSSRLARQAKIESEVCSVLIEDYQTKATVVARDTMHTWVRVPVTK